MDESKSTKDILEYQPDAVEIEERPVPGKIRWVLYLILLSLVLTVVGAIVFKVDRVVVAEGELITNTPTIVVQSLSTAVIRTINVQVGDVVEKDQVLATLDPTFATADLSQLNKQKLTLGVQVRRIRAELDHTPFAALPEEGDDGKLQEQVLIQRRLILEKNKRMTDDKIAALRAKLALNTVQRRGQEQQYKLLRDVEGTTAKRPQQDEDYRLRLLEAQKARYEAANAIETLKAEALVTRNELRQAESDWQRFVEERKGELMEQEVSLRAELEKVQEELHKAERVHDLISLRAPEKGIVLKMAERSVGSILQQAEPFFILVPYGSVLEAEVNVGSKDIGRIRTGDTVRIKFDAFPFQRHDTLPGAVRVISENAFQHSEPQALLQPDSGQRPLEAFYKTRIHLLSTQLRNVPEGFRLIPGMKVRAEIKVGKRSVISYFLYPIIRVLDESLREP
ncbi:HlyD family type I secretion periplasmic adaptor subunit [Desulfobulbus rhabdoformis]|uniref:HlyD family type I secretion periplasmic adaptor subunit n=1 Tax=Desulfobulbus rhabdoformis TaxID=34032 RepID=UPI0019664346|nr:HlyD family type I secretion periplasmic adaptor subunit [Desulfobulbus rhabdoformis]MBM9615637.1 HlyD family type I secretion periplasmic adaptor subunit [Desulfobulbus rhabdoformis]